MKNRVRREQKLDTMLDRLDHRLTAARAETKRSAARHAATKRKLDAIGEHLAQLTSELAEVSAAKARSRRPSA